MTRRRTGDWVSSARAVEYGIALARLRSAYEAWANEDAEVIDVVQAAARFLEAEARANSGEGR